MNNPTISLDQLNYYQWQRQGFDLARSWTDFSAREAQVGLYGTGATLYPSLLARYTFFHFPDLGADLYERRSLIRLRAMRGSLFAIPVPVLPVVFQATRQRTKTAFQQLLAASGMSQVDYERLAGQIDELLAGRSLTAAEIKKALPDRDKSLQTGRSFVLGRMCAVGALARGRVRGSWRSDQTEYARFADWLPGVELEAVSPAQAQVELARLYFAAYSPATFEDFRWWSGLPKEEAEQAFNGVKDILTALEIPGLPGGYFLLEQDLETLRRTPADAPRAIAMLPVWDAYLMAYRERRRYLAPEWNDRVFDPTGNAASAILLGGRIAGVWDTEEDRRAFTLKVALFEQAGLEIWSQLGDAARRLAGEVRPQAFDEVRLLRCPPPSSLVGESQNRFRSPLRNVAGETISIQEQPPAGL
jgi:hypothetical protein